jgi:patatin-related protein
MKKPDFNRQTRLGLVLYGGIALAIYINGVCQEFFNAQRGRGIYKLLKALTDSDIVVDIISGTSAGGINGVLLSHALANSTNDSFIEFSHFASIWRLKGDISSLLHVPKEKHFLPIRESFIDGENYYQDALADAIQKAKPEEWKGKGSEWPSEFHELDLFITGTDFLGRHSAVLDQTGKVIEIKDHRSVFRLKHRKGRTSTFELGSSTNAKAMAKLCRLTSCIPIAFPVVSVSLEKGRNQVDNLLVEWGKLEARALPPKKPSTGLKLHFVDGGFLDNKPFSHTLKEISLRTAERPVRRILFYLDPSPDKLSESDAFKQMPRPNILQAGVGAFYSIPRYESIGGDLADISEYNERVRRFKFLRGDLDAHLEKLYPSSEFCKDETNDPSVEIYLRSRLVDLKDKILPLLLNLDLLLYADPDAESTKCHRRTIDRASALFASYKSGKKRRQEREEALEKFEKTIRNLDVEYALRKHFYIVEALWEQLDNLDAFPEEAQEAEALPASLGQRQENQRLLRALAYRLNRQIKVLEITRDALGTLFGLEEVQNYFYNLLATEELDDVSLQKVVYKDLLALVRFLLNARHMPFYAGVDGGLKVAADFYVRLPSKAKSLDQVDRWLTQQDISDLREQLRKRAVELSNVDIATALASPEAQNSENENDNTDVLSLLLCVERASERLIQNSGLPEELADELLNRFKRFRLLDQFVYPLEYTMASQEKVIINAVRISPADAKLGFGKDKDTATKLAGERLSAFGGFLKKAWRSNDILWGRLDGLNRLVETLLTEEVVEKTFPAFLERINEPDVEGYLKRLVSEAIPNGSAHRTKIENLLISLDAPNRRTRLEQMQSALLELGSIPAEDNSQLIQEFLRELREALVLANQELIVSETLPIVSEDIRSDLRWYWNAEAPSAKEIERQQRLEKLAKSDDLEKKLEYFVNEYQIGSEGLQNIPPEQIEKIAQRFVLILRDCIIGFADTSLGHRLQFNEPIFEIMDRFLPELLKNLMIQNG